MNRRSNACIILYGMGQRPKTHQVRRHFWKWVCDNGEFWILVHGLLSTSSVSCSKTRCRVCFTLKMARNPNFGEGFPAHDGYVNVLDGCKRGEGVWNDEYTSEGGARVGDLLYRLGIGDSHFSFSFRCIVVQFSVWYFHVLLMSSIWQVVEAGSVFYKFFFFQSVYYRTVILVKIGGSW